MVGVYQIKPHGNYIYKYLKTDNEVGEKLLKRLKKTKQLEIFKYLIENLYLNTLIGNHVVKGTCLANRGDYMSPLIIGPRLSDKHRLMSLSNNTLVELIIAIGILTQSLTQYYVDKGYIIGDWTLHNIIFNLKTGQLVNIDLEGFYTYSPLGLDLSWNSGENKYTTIKRTLTRLQKRLVTRLYQRLKEKPPSTSTKEITLVNIPNAYQLSFPLLVTSKYPQIRKYSNPITLLDLDDNNNNNNNTFKVYINLTSDKPSQLVISNSDKYQNNQNDRSRRYLVGAFTGRRSYQFKFSSSQWL